MENQTPLAKGLEQSSVNMLPKALTCSIQLSKLKTHLILSYSEIPRGGNKEKDRKQIERTNIATFPFTSTSDLKRFQEEVGSSVHLIEIPTGLASVLL